MLPKITANTYKNYGYIVKKIAILIPTRERPADLKLFLDSWVKYTEGLSDLWIQVDKDDPTDYHFVKKYNCIKLVGDREPFLHILNGLAKISSKQYDYVGFMEDDCCFTQLWEKIFIDKLDEIKKEKGYGIVWGNDNINKENIVGLPFMTSNIVKTLGYMSPPELEFLWADYFWKHLGQALDCLHYFPDILIEHRHYSTGKREKCKISEIVDKKGEKDYYNYMKYQNQGFENDVKKLKASNQA